MPSRFPLAESAGLVLDELSTLLRSEMRLLKAEVRENASNFKVGLGLAATAAVLALLGLGKLLDGAAALLVTRGFTDAGAAALTGTVVLGAALLLGWLGSRRLSSAALTPERSLEALRSRPRETAEERQ